MPESRLFDLITVQGERLARIETHLETLVGNGQPGTITRMQDDIEVLKTARNYAVGFGAALIALQSAIYFILHKLGF